MLDTTEEELATFLPSFSLPSPFLLSYGLFPFQPHFFYFASSWFPFLKDTNTSLFKGYFQCVYLCL